MLLLIILLGILYNISFNKPKNSIELYQYINNSQNYNQARKLSSAGYADQFNIEVYENIKSKIEPSKIRQFTILEYEDGSESIFIETTPGTTKLKVLNVDELPESTSDFFKTTFTNK